MRNGQRALATSEAMFENVEHGTKELLEINGGNDGPE